MKHSQSTTEILQELGYRLTPQRIMIMDAVEQADSHISVEEIYGQVYRQYPHMNISTVYRTLELLEKLVLVIKTDLGDGRVRYHSINKGHHHHLVCHKCGVITDMEESSLNPLRSQILRNNDFKINMKHLALFGLCSNCQE